MYMTAQLCDGCLTAVHFFLFLVSSPLVQICNYVEGFNNCMLTSFTVVARL